MYFFLLFFLLNTITYSGTVNSKEKKPSSLTLTIAIPSEGLIKQNKNNPSLVMLRIGHFGSNDNCKKKSYFLSQETKIFDLTNPKTKQQLIEEIKKLDRIEFRHKLTKEGQFKFMNFALSKYEKENPNTIDPKVIFEIFNQAAQLDPSKYELGKEVSASSSLAYQNRFPTAQLSGSKINNIVLIPFHKFNCFSKKITPFLPNTKQQEGLFVALIMKYNGLLNGTAIENSLKIVPDLSKKPNRVKTFMQNPNNKKLLDIFFPALKENSNKVEELAQENKELDKLLDELEKIAMEDTK